MKRRHRVGVTGVSAASIVACLALLCVPAVSNAADQTASPAEAADRGSALLAHGSGYGEPQAQPRVRALQRSLRALGHRPGPVDGLYGPLTEAAVERLQHDSGLSVDGIVGPQTRRVLKADAAPLVPGAGYGRPGGSRQVRAVQRSLRTLGHRPGPVDGLYGPGTRASVERFQREAGQPASGVLSPATAVALARAESDRPAPRADSSPAGGSDQTRTRAPKPADDRTARPDSTESPSALLLAALALALAAIAAVLAAWLKGRRRQPQATRVREAAKPRTSAVAPSSREPRRRRHGTAALGYVSVLAPESANGQELRGQLAAIDTACRQRDLVLKDVIRDVEQGNDRGPASPGMRNAFERLAAGEASCLVVAELGRLGRSAPRVGYIVGWLRRRGIRLVAIDAGLDTGMKSGREAADTLVSLCAFDTQRPSAANTGGSDAEPQPIERTNGGRPARDDVPRLKERIQAMRASGMTLQAIADRLNAENVPTLRGGTKWRPSGVQSAAGYRRPGREASEPANGGERAADGSSERRREQARRTASSRS
jgi:peptidoglycan hydrolase-like protein with peptidoglycan-binding domain/DNA invertase Pin-like site-specific DNA recombinase